MSQADGRPSDVAMARAAAAAASAERLMHDIDDAVRSEQADSLIKSYVFAAAAAGLVPASLFDVAAVAMTQVAMARALARHYEVRFDEIRAKTLIIALLASSTPALSVIALSSGAKLIPGIGTLFGSGSVAVAGGAATYAVGRVLKHHFERGGSLLDADFRRLRARFKPELRRGREIAAQAVRNCRQGRRGTARVEHHSSRFS